MRMFGYDWPPGWEEFSSAFLERRPQARTLKLDERRLKQLLNAWMTTSLWEMALGKPGCIVDDLEYELKFAGLIMCENRLVLDGRGNRTSDWFVVLSGNNGSKRIVGAVTPQFADLVIQMIKNARHEAKMLLELRDADLVYALLERNSEPANFWRAQCSHRELDAARATALEILEHTGPHPKDLFNP